MRIKAWLVDLNQYQRLPYDRTCQLAEDLFSRTISQGTLYNWNPAGDRNLESTEGQICRALLASEVVHFDETGIRQQGKLHGLHTAGTSRLTCDGLHARRGAASMIDLWFEAKETSEATPENCLAEDAPELASLRLRYDALIAKGLEQNIPPLVQEELKKKQRRRPKPSKAKHMLDRLRDFKPQVLAFLTHPPIPFDNNQGERDTRRTQLQQNISGCFRGSPGGDIFARLRGYVSTRRKNDRSILAGLPSTFHQPPTTSPNYRC